MMINNIIESLLKLLCNEIDFEIKINKKTYLKTRQCSLHMNCTRRDGLSLLMLLYKTSSFKSLHVHNVHYGNIIVCNNAPRQTIEILYQTMVWNYNLQIFLYYPKLDYIFDNGIVEVTTYDKRITWIVFWWIIYVRGK